MHIVWLASYPRSGNTLLRTVLWQCFGLRSSSLYPNDLGGNEKLEQYVGHVERSPDIVKQLRQENGGVPLIKTHEPSGDANPAIYVIRDGRAACVSLWKFYKARLNPDIPLEVVIEGKERFGTWADHVKAWDPWTRPNTLLFKYEALLSDMPGTLAALSGFLKKDIISTTIPDRNTIAAVDGTWVKEKTSWRSELSGANLQRFEEINREVLEKAGYLE